MFMNRKNWLILLKWNIRNFVLSWYGLKDKIVKKGSVHVSKETYVWHLLIKVIIRSGIHFRLWLDLIVGIILTADSLGSSRLSLLQYIPSVLVVRSNTSHNIGLTLHHRNNAIKKAPCSKCSQPSGCNQKLFNTL